MGLMASEEGAGVDFGRMREARRTRLLDAMALDGLDALILGKPANIRYASGARQLWTAGSRPFAPACVVVGNTGSVHLLSVWDEGVPAEIPHDHLFGLFWDPTKLMAWVEAIPGLRSARRVGMDALSPTFAALLAERRPRASIVDAGAALARARSVKTPDELRCIRLATAAAEAAMTAILDALRPGVSERELLALAAERVAKLGVPILASQRVASVPGGAGTVAFPQSLGDRVAAEGDLVVLDPSVLYAGYEGGLGRTWRVGAGSPSGVQGDLAERGRTLHAALVAECRVGRRGADLVRSWAQTGEPLPPVPFVHGVGLGVERPLIGGGIGADEMLERGSVLSVSAWVAREGDGGYFERDLVLVRDDTPVVLSRFTARP